VGLKRSLEKLDMPRKSKVNSVGNKACVRVFTAAKVDARRAPQGLPFNWYNPSWWQTLSDLEKTILEPGPEKPIPELVCLFRSVLALAHVTPVPRCKPRVEEILAVLHYSHQCWITNVLTNVLEIKCTYFSYP
jgi:hypothetical protein